MKRLEVNEEPEPDFKCADESEEEVQPLPKRSAGADERPRKVREGLLKRVSTAAKIKGDLYGKEATENRWNRSIAVSTDNTVLEVGPHGEFVDITASLSMANTSGFDAHEALKAAQLSARCATPWALAARCSY